MNERQEQQNLEKFIEMVNEAKICMMITEEKDAENLSGRPMAINKVEEDGSIWFFTKETSHLADELEIDKKVSLAIISESNDTYLMIHGRAELSEERAKIEELWKPMLKAWFPKGVDDPDMKLICVKPNIVDYWDTKTNKMVQLMNMAKSIVQGKQFQGGERGKLNL